MKEEPAHGPSLLLCRVKHRTETEQMAESSWLGRGTTYTITNIMVHNTALTKGIVDSRKPCCQAYD